MSPSKISKSKAELACPQRDDSRPSLVAGANPARLAAYLAAGFGASLVGTPDAEAAVVAIDIGATGLNITGANAGVANGNKRSISNWLGAGTGTIEIFNSFISRYWGFDGNGGLQFAINGSPFVFACPRNFGAGTTIGAVATTWSDDHYKTPFKYSNFASPDFGAGSFMGFRFGAGSNWNYGYLEVTWTSSSNTFQILSGAYESTVNTAILAGATPVPAPSALALLALGGGAFRRARARAA